LSESDGDAAGGSVDPPHVSSGACGLPSGQPDEVSTSAPDRAVAGEARVQDRLAAHAGQKDRGGGLSASGDGADVRDPADREVQEGKRGGAEEGVPEAAEIVEAVP